MHIAMFTDYFFPELGGIQDSIAIVSRALASRGHRIDIYAPRYGTRDYRIAGAASRDPDLGLNVHVRRRLSLPFPSSTQQSRVALASPIAPALMASRGRPDVIHVHSFFGIGLEALFLGATLKLPVIGTNHTTIAGFAPHIPVSARHAAAYVRWFYGRCDHVTAPSRSVFDELGAANRPLSVISNPIDTALFAPAPALSKAERDAEKSRFGLAGPIVTYAGRLGVEKNIDVLLHAMAAMRAKGDPAARLVIAGHGSYEPALRALAARLGIETCVSFAGTLAPKELARLLRVTDIFTIMSTSETQSMVLLQAMASGVPVVAARSRALPEFVTPDNGVLVDPDDAGQLAGVLSGLLAAPERRSLLGLGGRRSAECFAVDAIAGAWETLYQSVLEGRRSR